MTKKSKKTLLEFDKSSVTTFDLLKASLRGGDKPSPTNTELFMIAVMYGFANGNKVDDVRRSGTGPRVEYLTPEEDALLGAVQLADTGDAASLSNFDLRYEIAEKYAEGGIRLLKAELEKPGDFAADFATKMLKLAQSVSVDPVDQDR